MVLENELMVPGPAQARPKRAFPSSSFTSCAQAGCKKACSDAQGSLCPYFHNQQAVCSMESSNVYRSKHLGEIATISNHTAYLMAYYISTQLNYLFPFSCTKRGSDLKLT